MNLLNELNNHPNIQIHEVYTNNSFEVIVNEGTWYFVAEDKLGRWEVSSQHCNDRNYFNSAQQAYKFITQH